MSQAYERAMERRRAQEEELLRLPERFAEHVENVENLAERVGGLEGRLNSMDRRFMRMASWSSRLRDYALGGFVGAVIGVVLTKLVGS